MSDVIVTDTNGDGTGDAILSFPGGESITLVGLSVGEVSDPSQLEAMGIPADTLHSDISQMIYLGNFAELDTDEATNGYEGSTAPIIGTTLSGASAQDNVVTFSYDDVDGDGRFEANHRSPGENLTVGGVSSPIDEIVMATVQLTYLDGTTLNTSVIGYQLENGDFYLSDFIDHIEGQSVTSLEVLAISDTGDLGALSGFMNGGSYDLDAFTFVDPLDHVVEGTSGDDQIGASYTGDPDGDVVDGNDHSDGSNRDEIQAGAGNDTVYAGDGDDTVYGGDGADSITGDDGADEIYGGAGNDTIRVGSGDNLAHGGDDNDTLVGSTGSDTLYGDAGNDFIAGSQGNDSIDGGAGDDSVAGSTGHDTVRGGEGDDTVTGYSDNDLLFGDAGHDILKGGDGEDTLTGGSGNDTLDGGLDGDVAVFSGAWADYTITEADGVYTVTDNRPNSPDGTDTVTNVELFRFS